MTPRNLRVVRTAISEGLWGDLMTGLETQLPSVQYDWGTTQPFHLPGNAVGECDNAPMASSQIRSTLSPDPSRERSVDELKAWMATGRVSIVDVRDIEEYAVAHIPGSERVSIPAWEPADQNYRHPVVVVCRSGRRSREAVDWLRAQGWMNAYSLRGGLVAWMRAQEDWDGEKVDGLSARWTK